MIEKKKKGFKIWNCFEKKSEWGEKGKEINQERKGGKKEVGMGKKWLGKNRYGKLKSRASRVAKHCSLLEFESYGWGLLSSVSTGTSKKNLFQDFKF